ncbi:MAG: 2-phospho-L-lactate guanylyltransferase [Anaerolineae bacterium]
MQRVWAIVPIKPLAQAKSRLAPALDPTARRHLVLTLLRHTLTVLRDVEGLARVLVVSADAEVATVAREHDAHLLPEPRAPGLNVSLTRAATEAQAQGATGVLIVPGDLPLLEASNVEAVLDAALPPPSVVLVPDHRERGTNVLLLSPPRFMPFCYGPDSFHRHLALAEARGVHPTICRIPTLAFDADLPEDLALIEEQKLT